MAYGYTGQKYFYGKFGMLKRTIVLALVLGSVLLIGCGQKGPLYLPAPPEAPIEVKNEPEI
jgi:predicted small lipoprotein YifL